MNKNYELLGVSEYATDEEITAKYNELVEKYRNDRFLEGEAGNEAARKLTQIQVAYAEIMEERKQTQADDNGLYKDIEKIIADGDLKLAQSKLDDFNERTAEWHYLQARIFYKKNWHNECKKQLEIAMSMDEGNQKYKSVYEELKKKTSAPDDYNVSGSGDRQFSSQEAQPQMGGGSCLDFCCQMIACNMLLNCCCNCN